MMIKKFARKANKMTKEEKRCLEMFIKDITKGQQITSMTQEKFRAGGEAWINYTVVCK